MTKYHVNDAGEPGRCTAKIECPFKLPLDQHYSSPEEARAAYEASMENQTFGTNSSATNSYTPITKEWLENADTDTQRTVMSAIGKVFGGPYYRHQENSLLKVLEETNWNAVYNSTVAGQLGIQRRVKEKENSGPNVFDYVDVEKEITEVEDFLNSTKGSNLPIIVPEDPGEVLDKYFSTVEPISFKEKISEKEKQSKLALISADWISRMTPEELEAVSWMTSNGTFITHQHLTGSHRNKWSVSTYPNEEIEKRLRSFQSAMTKVPELSEPIIIYRGTKSENLGYLDSDEIELGVPASSSCAGSVAIDFTNGTGENVMLEIKTNKVASVVGLSEWGSSEMEVMAPLGKYKKVGEFTTMRTTKNRFRRDGFVEEDDTVRIIQLEYIGQ